MRHRFQSLLGPGLLAVAAFAAPQSASAGASLDYSCQYLLAGTGAAKIDVDAFTRETVFDPFLEPAELTVAATQTPLTAQRLQAYYPGIKTIAGTGTAKIAVRFDDGFSLDLAVPLVIEPSTVGAAGVALYGSGKTPRIELDYGNAEINAGGVSYNLQALDAEGDPILYAGPDVDGETWPDSDGDRSTWDVRCNVAPAGQNLFVSKVESNMIYEACYFGGDYCPVPSAPRHPRVINIAPHSAELRWTKNSTRGYGDYAGFSYSVEVDGRTLRTSESSVALTGLSPNTTYAGTIRATYPGGGSVPPKTSGPTPFTFTTPPSDAVDATPPSTPTSVDLVRADLEPTSLNLKWGASVDEPGGSGLKEYVVEWNGGTRTVPAGTTSTRIDGFSAPLGEVRVVAVDQAGNRSAPLVLTPYETIPDSWRPTMPGDGALTDADITATSVNLKWGASVQPGGPGVKEYRVSYDEGAVSRTVPADTTSVLFTGLGSDSEYLFQVVAVGQDGLESKPLELLVITRPAPTTQELVYTLGGTARMKTLTGGALPIRGGLQGQLTTATGAFLGNLTLAETQGRLLGWSFLPLTAKFGFVESGKTTGAYAGGVLTTSSRIRVKVLEVKLFGAIPLAGGNTCQTRQLSTIALKSGAGFTLESGGSLSGTFSLSDLNGCGFFNGLVSPLTTSGSNTLTLTATTKNQLR